MQRYFVDQMSETQAKIFGEDVHHITRVMRMSVGDTIFCCYNGRVALCAITEITNDMVLADVVEWVKNSNELPIKVCIASGLPKGDKLEYVIQKGTELGASEFVPFVAARSIVKWDEKKGQKKVERWEKIAKEAAEQSHRAMIPNVTKPLSFKELLSFSGSYTYKVVAYEEDAKRGESSNLSRVLSQLKHGESLFVVIGPEGGLTEKEVESLIENEFISCSLGPRILRTETAPLYVLSAVSYYFELAR
ncbi:16S rRNA (uracil(1498)-N(3))-methyltransferase [Bacillus timonensis]|uniref:Ribosomal RNA small subunit methyltransferase E n=1 Tax=Bacillus timonensis TaxID=1033734 RepID=A0A4S3PZN7_9BACI|nr:16S rRNA (uracil(1498)-N(3))-methyltransferase [Bacillus timonensis]THE15411.1 16S rRNA (uracil(1498)-N(3))-methyltransferase [Bacillus timonensis]